MCGLETTWKMHVIHVTFCGGCNEDTKDAHTLRMRALEQDDELFSEFFYAGEARRH